MRKKILSAVYLMIILFLGFFLFFERSDYEIFTKNIEIEKSPEYALAEIINFDSSIKTYMFSTNKGVFTGSTNANYQVHDKYIEIVYFSENPNINTVKTYFNMGKTKKIFYQYSIVNAFVSFIVSLVLSLLLSWKFGWLKNIKPYPQKHKLQATIKPKISINQKLTNSIGMQKVPKNKQLLDTIYDVQAYIRQISERLDDRSYEWVRNFDTKKISDYMTYKEANRLLYVTFGELTKENKVDYLAHQVLFFIVNDMNSLKLLLEIKNKNSSNLENQFSDLIFRMALNTIYLKHYLISLESHIKQNILQAIQNEQSTDAKSIYTKTLDAYMQNLHEFANKNNYFKDKLHLKIHTKTINSIPIIPIALSTVLDKEVDLLNIYMTKEMGQQMRAWLASQQAQAMSK